MTTKTVAIALVALMVAPVARATTLTWDVNVTATDPGTAATLGLVGHFTFTDTPTSLVDSGTVTGVCISATGSCTTQGADVFNLDTTFSSNGLQAGFDDSVGNHLLLGLWSPISNAATTPIEVGSQWAFLQPAQGQGFSCLGVCPLTGFITPEVSVPEPGTLSLLGLGRAGLGLMRRRKAG